MYSSLPLLGSSFGDGFVLSETNIDDDELLSDSKLQTRTGESSALGWSSGVPMRRPTFVLNTTYGPTEIHVTWRRPDSLEAYRYRVYRFEDDGRAVHARERGSRRLYALSGHGARSEHAILLRGHHVDSCGNEGPPCAEKTATTSPPQLAGWPQKVGKETASSVKIGDIDGDTHPDIVVGSDYIHAWHADGMELRDGDSQPLTWGIFSDLGSNFTATCALANLDGVPGLEIVGSSWNTMQIYIFNKNGDGALGLAQNDEVSCLGESGRGGLRRGR